MPVYPSSPPGAAMLLVLLPLDAEGQGTATVANLRTLQHQLGPAVRVLRIYEATHPAVVHSFRLPVLPAWVLLRQGVELWRQPGMPTAELVASLLPTAALPTALNSGIDINQVTS
jgi:hypothetical protein